LHEGVFASLPIRWFYFLSGLTGCVMIASGMVLWTTKRRKKALSDPAGIPFSFKMTEGLNIGTIVGLPAAVAVYFLANRLLPLEFEGRAQWEMHSLFITWLVCLAHGMYFTWQNRGRVAWYQQWLVAALLFTLVPIVNALTTSRGLLASIAQGDWVYVSFDASCAVAGLVCLWIAIRVNRSSKQPDKAQFAKRDCEVMA
jgi:uncharacterized iron-regulated membrane protein